MNTKHIDINFDNFDDFVDFDNLNEITSGPSSSNGNTNNSNTDLNNKSEINEFINELTTGGAKHDGDGDDNEYIRNFLKLEQALELTKLAKQPVQSDQTKQIELNQLDYQLDKLNNSNVDAEFLLNQLFDTDVFDEEMFNDIMNNITQNMKSKSQNEQEEEIKQEQLVECNCCCTEFNIFDTNIKYISHIVLRSKKPLKKSKNQAQNESINDSHYFCSKCVTSYFKHNMNSRNMFRCFSSDGCTHLFPRNEFIACVEMDTRDEYEDILYRQDLYKECLKKQNFELCPKCQMSGNQITSKTQYYQCSYCLYSWCSQCKLENHNGKDCYMFDNLTVEQIQLAIEELISEIQHPKCPTCKVVLQKDEGCNHMICSQCKTESCYVCGKIYNCTIRGSHINFSKACSCSRSSVSYSDAIQNNKKKVQDKLNDVFNKNNYCVRKIITPIIKKHGFFIPLNMISVSDFFYNLFN